MGRKKDFWWKIRGFKRESGGFIDNQYRDKRALFENSKIYFFPQKKGKGKILGLFGGPFHQINDSFMLPLSQGLR